MGGFHPKNEAWSPPKPRRYLEDSIGVVVGFDVVEPHDTGQVRGAVVRTGELGLLVQVGDLLRSEGGLQHILQERNRVRKLGGI